MSRLETILIRTELPVDDVAEQLGRALDATPEPLPPDGGPVVSYRLPDLDAAVWLDREWLGDAPELAYGYDYTIDVAANCEGDDYEAQEVAARAVYDQIVAATDWGVRLTRGALGDVLATRDRGERAA